MKEYQLGEIAGLRLSATSPALVGSLILWVALSVVGVLLLSLPAIDAIVAGLVAVAVHWVDDIAHQLGHSWAARRTGYPMTRLRLGMWGLFSTSLYPHDEPPLPAAIHIQRALGGPLASLLLTAFSALVALALLGVGGTLMWLGLFFFIDNLIILLGAFLPLGFTDASTLLNWMGKP